MWDFLTGRSVHICRASDWLCHNCLYSLGMQTVEKPSSVSVDEPKSNPLLNGQHLSSPSSSSSEECASNGDSADSTSKNGSEVPPPDPTSGILSPFRLSEEKLGHIQITKVRPCYSIFQFHSFLNLSEQHKQSEALYSLWSKDLGRPGDGSCRLRSISRRLVRMVFNCPTWIERWDLRKNRDF